MAATSTPAKGTANSRRNVQGDSAVRQYIIHVRVPSIFKRSQGATVVKIVTNAKKGIPPGREPTAVPKHLKK
jgi:hypothetical protein